MDHLPNEILEVILNNLEFTDLLKLRLVSSSWKERIQDFRLLRKTSLALIQDSYMEKKSSRHATTNDRTFHRFKNRKLYTNRGEEFSFIRIRFYKLFF